ncbi:MAG: beta-galactosidase BgaS [Zestosphaera sp.]
MRLPDRFLFGFSEAGFQFEMGFPGLEDAHSDWWVWVHDPDNIASGVVSGHLPEDGPGYLRLYRSDHEIARGLGANALRLGVEWSRLFPESTRDVPASVEKDEEGGVTRVDLSEGGVKALLEKVNMSAVERYRMLFRDWVERGGKLILNLNHFTLPLWLHNPVEFRRDPATALSGWLNENIIPEFVKYAYAVARLFDEYVDMWSTMNEPNVVATAGYLNVRSGFPPGIPSMNYVFQALRNEVVAHARAYDILKEVSGKPVGVIQNFMCFEPSSMDRPEDASAAETASTMYNYLFLDSVTKGESMLASSDSLRGRVDWIGVNYYTRMVVSGVKGAFTGWTYVPGYGFICQPGGVSRDGRPCSDFGWEAYPEGLERVLAEAYERYKLPLIVSENGVADATDRLRPSYLLTHLISTAKAIERGADVRGYLHWALTDNYEWASGFNMRFGLVKVDFGSKRRYLRPSALLYREIASRKEIPEELLFV